MQTVLHLVAPAVSAAMEWSFTAGMVVHFGTKIVEQMSTHSFQMAIGDMAFVCEFYMNMYNDIYYLSIVVHILSQFFFYRIP